MTDQCSFLRAVRDLTGDRIQRYVTIDAVAEHLGIEPNDAERIARRLDDTGMVRVGGGHSVTLEQAGRQMLKSPAVRRPSKLRGSRPPGPAR
jgi:Mn-dependent DtxR family transcriptional regulator